MSEIQVTAVKPLDDQNESFEVHLVSKTRDVFNVKHDSIVTKALKEYNVSRIAYDTRVDVFPIDEEGNFTSDPSRLAGFKQVLRVYRVS